MSISRLRRYVVFSEKRWFSRLLLVCSPFSNEPMMTQQTSFWLLIVCHTWKTPLVRQCDLAYKMKPLCGCKSHRTGAQTEQQVESASGTPFVMSSRSLSLFPPAPCFISPTSVERCHDNGEHSFHGEGLSRSHFTLWFTSAADKRPFWLLSSGRTIPWCLRGVLFIWVQFCTNFMWRFDRI